MHLSQIVTRSSPGKIVCANEVVIIQLLSARETWCQNVESAAFATAAFAARIAASRIASISIQLGETPSRRLDKRLKLVVVRFLFSMLALVAELALVVVFNLFTEISPLRDGGFPVRDGEFLNTTHLSQRICTQYFLAPSFSAPCSRPC